MVMQPESVRELEELLRGNGVTLTPMEQPVETEDLQTADGNFRVQPTRVLNRQEQLVTLYRTDTAEPVPTDVNEAIKRLRKRFPATGDWAATYPQLAGRYAFTLGRWDAQTQRYEPPDPLIRHETVGELCWLHPESPKLPYIRSLGIRSICRSKALRGDLEMEQHIKTKHDGVWPRIERDWGNRKQQEDRDRLAQLIEAVLAEKGIDTGKAPDLAERVMERDSGLEAVHQGDTTPGETTASSSADSSAEWRFADSSAHAPLYVSDKPKPEAKKHPGSHRPRRPKPRPGSK